MIVRHTDSTLEKLENENVPKSGLSADVVRSYRRKMQFIRAAKDERDFYAMKSLHYEKLSGKRAHQRSMRLNDQFRLILELKKDKAGNIIVIVSVEDYHK